MKIEETLQKLDAITATLESEDADLNKSVTEYAKALKLAQAALDQLEKADLHLKKLKCEYAELLSPAA
jgi:exodeoxyribonuclease VII small subunit